MSYGIEEQLSKQKKLQLWIGLLGLSRLCQLPALLVAFPIAPLIHVQKVYIIAAKVQVCEWLLQF